MGAGNRPRSRPLYGPSAQSLTFGSNSSEPFSFDTSSLFSCFEPESQVVPSHSSSVTSGRGGRQCHAPARATLIAPLSLALVQPQRRVSAQCGGLRGWGAQQRPTLHTHSPLARSPRAPSAPQVQPGQAPRVSHSVVSLRPSGVRDVPCYITVCAQTRAHTTELQLPAALSSDGASELWAARGVGRPGLSKCRSDVRTESKPPRHASQEVSPSLRGAGVHRFMLVLLSRNAKCLFLTFCC